MPPSTRRRTGRASTRSVCRHEWIDAAEIRRRWPAFDRGTVVDDDVMGIYSRRHRHRARWTEPPATLQRLAVEHGAVLRPHSPVRSVRPIDGEVDVATDYRHGAMRAVVICADAWTNRLIEPLGQRRRAGPSTANRSATSRPTDLEDLRPGRFPVWIWMHDPSYYGFPTYGPGDVADCAKGSEDCGGSEVDPDTRTFEPDPTMEARLERVHGRSARRPLRTATHDDLPVHAHRTIAISWSIGSAITRTSGVGLGAAHGFKFASWFGRTLVGSGDRRQTRC